MKKLRSFISSFFQHCCNAKNEKRNSHLELASCELVNVTEFNGAVYVSYNGVPLVPADEIKIPVAELLQRSRKAYVEWKRKFER